MRRSITFRRCLVSLMVLFLLFVATFSSFVFVRPALAANNSYVAIAGSYSGMPAGAHLGGQHAGNSQLTISVALHSRNEAELNNLLSELYDPSNPRFHQWLARGEFNALFAPAASQIAQVQSFLSQAGLSVSADSSTPFLVQATGTTAQMEAAFHTQLNDYTAANGQAFFQNDSAVQIPASLSNVVLGVMGLSNTARLYAPYITTRQGAEAEGKPVPQYGAGPGGSGLVPSQAASLYGANGVYQMGNRGKGEGAALAVFELSGYTPADIVTYEHRFFGPSENVPLVNVNVDGGPITPVCPKGDQCSSADYSGDIEVEADIETQIALAPKIDRVLVYNAPNDLLGITVLDEYFKIANDNLADSISSSWGACEPDIGLAQAQAEFIAFEQMATQGQSMFAAAGDTGAYGCLRDTGSPNVDSVAVSDPASQPYVTGVGGTSFGTFDPGSNLYPSYPQGFETVWNVLDQCSGTGLTSCLDLGAGGGGVSRFWGRPSYQQGPGVINSLSQESPYCSQAVAGQYCREVPDVSANADEFTPYAKYCTGDPTTNSTCASISSGQTVPGWFGIGGTSLASPLWSGIIALWDSVHGQRFGNANEGLYTLFQYGSAYSWFFHDITGVNQTENNNGLYPTTPNYDMATGIGTPSISAIARTNP